MYNWEDIIILGDSFCGSRYEVEHWPNIVANSLSKKTNEPQSIFARGQGFPGASWWSPRKLLLDELKKSIPEVLIFCHTDAFRLPHNLDWGINYASAIRKVVQLPFSHDTNMPEKFSSAAQLYFEELIVGDFHEWAQLQWFLELDRIIEQNKEITRVVHLHCFENNYIFKQGVTCTTPLLSLTIFEEKLKRGEMNAKPDMQPNHFSIEDNQKLANEILNVINNYPGDGATFTIKEFT
jgi:hypothetical protein